MEDEYLVRKCATVISKSKIDLEILDTTSFDTLKAGIDEVLFNQATVNDKVTYVQTDEGPKILEIRK